MDHNNMYQIRGLKMLYEGDGYAKLNKVRKESKTAFTTLPLFCIISSTPMLFVLFFCCLALQFDLAQHMYEAQIMWIRSRPRVDIKTLAICHGRLGKMFLNLG